MAANGETLPLALTMGEPGGISAEITIKAWRALHKNGPPFFIIDDPERYDADEIPATEINTPEDAAHVCQNALPIFPISLKEPIKTGVADSRNASTVIDSIKNAVDFTVSGRASAIVTNPIQKSALLAAGFSFPGHTEFLADLTSGVAMPKNRIRGPVMMLAGPALRTVPVTVHQSLNNAIDSLSIEQIIRVATVTAEALKSEFGIEYPRLAVAGVNPHAGEAGAFGDEDEKIVKPAVEALQASSINATGPLPADTMFHDEARDRYDAAICMYHDQALIPVKTLDFHNTVNVTLGLPVVRTSPDHGAALDIAGAGKARPDSLIAAINLASNLAAKRID